MNVRDELVGIVGPEWVFDHPEKLRAYAEDYSISSLSMPSYVAQPQNSEEVRDIVQLANLSRVPVVPCSSGIHFNGDTIPIEGGIVLDLRRMNRILNIDERNRAARIEAGVTWPQLQHELERHNLMALNPLFPHPLKSVLTSHLEREPMLIPKFEYADALLTMEVILPNGELFRTGSACVQGAPDKSVSDGVHPEGPGLGWWRLLQGAQGTMGVVTWANIKVEMKPGVNKTFLIPFEAITDTADFIYKVQRRMLGEECLLLNNFNLASILAENWPEDFEALRQTLPPWTVILVLAGGWRRPEEKIEYEEEALREIALDLHITNLPPLLPGMPELEKELPEILRWAWPAEKTFWKFRFKGSCQDLFFYTVLEKISAFTEAIKQTALKFAYPIQDIGFYIQPVERARACHYECSFYYNPENEEEVQKIRELFYEVAETLISMEAFFTRPYQGLADMVYDRAASYAIALKKVKRWLDPNNIMSPGRLCF